MYMRSETDNVYKIIFSIIALFEQKFAPSCSYFWPFASDFAYFTFSHGDEHLNLEQLFLKSKEKSLLYAFEPTNDILDILKKSPAWGWHPDQLLSSAVFFLFYDNIKKNKKLSSGFWYKILNSFMFLDTANQTRVLNLIKRSKFFYFYPNFAFEGAKEFFIFQEMVPDEFFFYTKASPETLKNILNLLELESNEVNFLINKTLKTKSFIHIVEFFSTNNLIEPNLTDKKVLTLLLIKFGLTENQRNLVFNQI